MSDNTYQGQRTRWQAKFQGLSLEGVAKTGRQKHPNSSKIGKTTIDSNRRNRYEQTKND